MKEQETVPFKFFKFQTKILAIFSTAGDFSLFLSFDRSKESKLIADNLIFLY